MRHKAKDSFLAHFQLDEAGSPEDLAQASACPDLPKDFLVPTKEGDSYLSFRDTVFVVFCDDELSRLNDED